MSDAGQPASTNAPDAMVEVVEYDGNWPQQFEQERRALDEALGGVATAIEHIGSTSVPGLCAKPTIDILVIVDDVTECKSRIDELTALGYDYRPASLTSGDDQLFFRKVAPEGKRTHHLHVLASTSARVNDYINFRDFLRAHPAESQSYAEMKRRLALKHAANRMRYIEEKSEYVDALVERVRSWKP